jgi:indole-3-glycerol phosphate synthase
MATILDQIVEIRHGQLSREKENIPVKEILKYIKNINDESTSFYGSLINAKKGLGIIAEVKKASPSKGVIKQDFNHLDTAKSYAGAEVEAMSVLTEEHYFQGSNKYLQEIHNNFPNIPLLRKDFLVDEYQIYHAKVLGASAVLLIASLLSGKELRKFYDIAKELGLDSLVEVHDKDETLKVLDALGEDLKILGINNRNLKTFKTDIGHTEEIIEFAKAPVTISESGINTREDVQRLRKCNVNGILVGESLMRSDNIGEKINELRG